MTNVTRWMKQAGLAALTLQLAALPAMAQGGPGMGPGGGQMGARFEMLDLDGDGAISRDEAAENRESVFAAMDADDSGDLTSEEYMAVRMGPGVGANPERQEAMQARKAARFGEMDADESGTVSRDEFAAGGVARFDATDADGNGEITRVEMRDARWGL